MLAPNKKTNILLNLKREVMLLRTQLDTLHKKKLSPSPYHSKHSKSKSVTRRFDTVNANNLTPEKGIRRFEEKQDHYHNLTELILNKSVQLKQPSLSPYRKAEHEKTKCNFDTDNPPVSFVSRVQTRNPLTGKGYDEKRTGIKIIRQTKASTPDRVVGRKHFSLSFYR